jgi:hypothetical protein
MEFTDPFVERGEELVAVPRRWSGESLMELETSFEIAQQPFLGEVARNGLGIED